MIIIINIFIAQIPCEYDQMRVTNMIQIKHNRLRIPNWWEADQLGIYKAWRSWIRGHRTQIHLVAEYGV